MSESEKKIELVGENLQPTEDMQVAKFDLMQIVSMRDFLSQIVRMTVSEDNYSLVLAGMMLLCVEAVDGREAQARANIDNMITIYRKLQELKDQQLKEKLARAKIDGQPS